MIYKIFFYKLNKNRQRDRKNPAKVLIFTDYTIRFISVVAYTEILLRRSEFQKFDCFGLYEVTKCGDYGAGKNLEPIYSGSLF